MTHRGEKIFITDDTTGFTYGQIYDGAVRIAAGSVTVWWALRRLCCHVKAVFTSTEYRGFDHAGMWRKFLGTTPSIEYVITIRREGSSETQRDGPGAGSGHEGSRGGDAGAMMGAHAAIWSPTPGMISSPWTRFGTISWAADWRSRRSRSVSRSWMRFPRRRQERSSKNVLRAEIACKATVCTKDLSSAGQLLARCAFSLQQDSTGGGYDGAGAYWPTLMSVRWSTSRRASAYEWT